MESRELPEQNIQSTGGEISHRPDGIPDIPEEFLNRENGELFFNRELSWLEFNFRVLQEAEREDNPLLERLKFLAISESNLDEFFMVRVAGLKQVHASSVNEIQMDGKTPLETLEAISVRVHDMVEMQYRILDDILNGLKSYGIEVLDSHQSLTPGEQEFVSDFYAREVFPVLTPFAVDPSHPFPHILSGRLNLALTLEHRSQESGEEPEDTFALIEVPAIFPRFLELPPSNQTTDEGRNIRRFLTMEEVLKLHASDFFAGARIKSMNGFTVLRNSDLSIDEVASENLLSTIEDELKNRMWGEAVRLNFRKNMPQHVREFLRERLDLSQDELYERPGILNLQDLWVLYGACSELKELKDVPFIPKNVIPQERPEKIFSIIRKGDILLHHPYDSFQTVVDFLSYSARDPNVLAIKQTLYRTSGDSPIVQSLIEAAENGKQVTALVELKARFDEENNIVWARRMEKHGIHVVYGLVGLKIHGKMLQVIRREDDKVRSYVHLSTGNYNPTTAKIYTDLGIITVDPEINYDVTRLFHALTGSSVVPRLKKIAAAPINMRETVVEMIENEISNANRGVKSGIRLKLNALVDPDMVLLLYRASRAGVKIELNIRGICCLKPGIKGLSENVTVTSIVGRFLEHSRIFHFENGGDTKLFLSSADLMPRNLNRRVEIFFPVTDPGHKQRLLFVLDSITRDNHNARLLHPDGLYTRNVPATEEDRFSSQRFFREETNKEFAQKEMDMAEQRKHMFQPVVNPDAHERGKDPVRSKPGS